MNRVLIHDIARTVMPTEHISLYEEVQAWMSRRETEEDEVEEKGGSTRGYRWVNGVPLNNSNPDILPNSLDDWESKGDKKVYSHQWITEITITKEKVYAVMRAG